MQQQAPIDTPAPAKGAPPRAGGRSPRPGGRALHVLILPSWYPSPDDPVGGIFVKEQVEALAGRITRIGIIYPDLRPLSTVGWRGVARNLFQVTDQVEGSLRVVRCTGWRVPRLEAVQGRIWLYWADVLGRHYARRHGRPDLIHAHSLLWSGVAARRIAGRWSIPYLVTEHRGRFVAGSPARGLLKDRFRRPLLAALRDSAGIIAVSDALAEGLRDYAGDRGLPVEVIPNAVDAEFFTPQDRRGRGEAPFRFLTIATLTPGKGVDVLIRAFARVAVDAEGMRLAVGGAGPQAGALRRLVAELGVAGRVDFLGPLTRRGVREAMQAAHCFVLPTLWESFGVVLIEAMAMGLPLVSTFSGGPEGIITPEVGVLVEPGDADALARAMLDAYGRRSAWDARRIRDTAVARYGRPAVAERIVRAYEKTVACGPGTCGNPRPLL